MILLYHRVTRLDADPWRLAVSPTNFASQMAALKHHADLLPLEALADGLRTGQLPPRPVAVTFDDGYADNLHEAKPVLEQYAIPATFFLSTRYLGAHREFWWDELELLLLQPGGLPRELGLSVRGQSLRWQLGEATRWNQSDVARWRAWCAWHDAPTPRHAIYSKIWELLVPLPAMQRDQVLRELRSWAQVDPIVRPTHRALSWLEATQLGESPYAQIGSHAMSHTALSGLSPVEQRGEIEGSKSTLERSLGCVVSTFSYPFGQASHYTEQTVSCVGEAGFSCACTNRNSAVPKDADPHQLPRIMAKNWSANQFENLLGKWIDGRK
jgi:peptidoglycan/xylan/chitin deacetylase (PgdA/CDA1 family)